MVLGRSDCWMKATSARTGIQNPPGTSPTSTRSIFVSAHWEAWSTGIEISKSAAPDMFYDHSGFPAESYELVYGSKGDPAFAARVSSLLSQSGVTSMLAARPYDHGTFVPMFLMPSQADIPVVTMSISDRMLDTKAHFELGRALAPLRDEDTLVITSGQATHNMYAEWYPEDHPIEPWALEFQSWLDETLSTASTQMYKERMDSISAWEKAPNASVCHHTPDHFTSRGTRWNGGEQPRCEEAQRWMGSWTHVVCQLCVGR